MNTKRNKLCQFIEQNEYFIFCSIYFADFKVFERNAQIPNAIVANSYIRRFSFEVQLYQIFAVCKFWPKYFVIANYF